MNGSRETGTPGGMDFRVLPLRAATVRIVTVRTEGAIPPRQTGIACAALKGGS